MEAAYLCTIPCNHHSHHCIKGDLVPLVANATHGHEGTSSCRNLEHRLDISTDTFVCEVELALAEIGYLAAVAHQELLSSFASR